MLTFDEAGARYYETGVSKGVLFPIDGSTGVPWNGLTAVSMDPSGGEYESYYFDGVKFAEKVLAEDFLATVQAISTPKEFEVCEGVRDYKPGVKTSFNKRDKFGMCWRTEIGSDQGESIGYRLHIAYNCLVQPSTRAYQTIADTVVMGNRSFTITATPACGRHSYFWFDSREYDLSALEAQLYSGVLPKCWELAGLVTASGGGGGGTTDPDADCPSLLTDFETYIHGQVVNDDVLGTDNEVFIYGKINNGLDVIELPAAGAFAANDSAASVVGTGNVLADDDDATYITSADGDLGYTVGLPPLVGYVDGAQLELHIRMSISGGVSPDDPDNLDADAQVHISTDATGDIRVGGFSDGTDEGMGFALSAVDGTPVDYVVPLKMDAWVDSTIDDVVTALKTGAYLNVVGATNNNPDTTPTPEVRVYEASVVMLNDTDPDKWLRTPAITDSAYVEQHIYTPSTTNDLVASNTVKVDFKILELAYDSAMLGDTQGVCKWLLAGSSNDPGVLQVALDGSSNPIIKWLADDGSTVLDSHALDLNTWYTLVVDWSWTEVRVRMQVRDGTAYVWDHTVALSADATCFVKHEAGPVADSTKAYEVVVDNAKMQVHCHDAAPLAPFTLDLPAWYCNDSGGADFANPARFTTKDDSGDYAIGPGGRIGVGYFAETDQGAVVSGNWVYMPATPSGYALTRATYVVRAYAASGHAYTGAPLSGYTPSPATSPYLNAESSGTSDNYAIDNLSTGGFAETEWSGNEVLSRLTNPPGSQLPCSRLWNEWADTYVSTADIHVSYYAIRLYYDPV